MKECYKSSKINRQELDEKGQLSEPVNSMDALSNLATENSDDNQLFL